MEMHKELKALILLVAVFHVGWVKFVAGEFLCPIDYAERILIVGIYLAIFKSIDIGWRMRALGLVLVVLCFGVILAGSVVIDIALLILQYRPSFRLV